MWSHQSSPVDFAKGPLQSQLGETLMDLTLSDIATAILFESQLDNVQGHNISEVHAVMHWAMDS